MKDRNDVPYKVIEYYVWIGHIWNCFEDLPWWKKAMWFTIPVYGFASYLFRVCTEKPEHLTCGGTLIAPRIVQTACHCLVTYVKDRYVPWRRAELINHFQNQRQIYMGKVDVLKFDYTIMSESFSVHPKCGEYNFKPNMLRYDIGWIVLSYEVPYQDGVFLGSWGQLDYAGPYQRQAIINKYQEVISQRKVCLVVGFGFTDKGRPARFMRQAWIQFIDHMQCYYVTYYTPGRTPYYTYNESASWVCATKMPNVSYNSFRGAHDIGDSGGPITCDNNYFALVSSDQNFKTAKAGFTEMQYHTAISYALEANSVEDRRVFEQSLLQDRALPITTVLDRDLRILKQTHHELVKQKYAEHERGSVTTA